jgi:hypothetical protein
MRAVIPLGDDRDPDMNDIPFDIEHSQILNLFEREEKQKGP